MKTISEFKFDKIRIVLTDIDGTLTQDGQLPAISYDSLWKLSRAGFAIIPVTGRPAGWCELIARLWPVRGVIGENGALSFSLQDGKMKRKFSRPKNLRKLDRANLRIIQKQVLEEVPGCATASDQFSRLFDLAIDFAEDVKPLPKTKIDQIVSIFKQHGAVAKVSNIHVNGWYGDYDKVSMCKSFLRTEFNLTPEQMKTQCAFVGDSPNDEPMFKFFPHSFAVANIKEFLDEIKHKPNYVSQEKEGPGFSEIAERLLVLQR